MSFSEMISSVESAEFSAKMNLASGRKFFLRLLDEDQLVLSFIDFIKENPDKVIDVLSRIESLSNIRINPRYENSNDIPLATYCWVLFKISTSVGKIAATMAASSSGIWWASEVAVYILEDSFATQKNVHSVVSELNLDKDVLRLAFKNTKISLIENLSIPIILFKDIAKYKIKEDYNSISTSSYIPAEKKFDWEGFLNNNLPKFSSFSGRRNNTSLVANWS